MGVSADGNGAYSIKVNINATFIISALDFMNVEVATGTQLIVDIVLEKRNFTDLRGEVVVIAGGMWRRNLDEEYRTTTISKRIAVFEVKEDNSGLLLDKAKITITRKADHKTDTAFTGKKGIYKFQGIKEHNSYVVKVEAAGYETNEFVVNGNDFTDRKKVWEVLLRRQKVEAVKAQDIVVISPIETDQTLDTKIKGLNITSTNKATSNFDTRIRVGGIRSINTYNEPLLTVDYLPVSFNHFASLNPNDIENIQVLKATVASLLYGTDARYGVIAITTKKKAREKRELAKNSVAKKMLTKVSDTLSTALNTNTLKVYPNPIKKGNTFFVSFKQQKVNDFWIRITDMQGRLLFQKQINALAKEHFEKIVADNKWNAGLYYISIINKNNQLTNKGSFIVQ